MLKRIGSPVWTTFSAAAWSATSAAGRPSLLAVARAESVKRDGQVAGGVAIERETDCRDHHSASDGFSVAANRGSEATGSRSSLTSRP